MYKKNFYTIFIILISLIMLSVDSLKSQCVPYNLPLNENESNEATIVENENTNSELNLNLEEQRDKKSSKIENDGNLNSKKEADNKSKKNENRKNTILKTSSSFVTVFYVLVSYLFSGAFDGPSQSNQTLN